MGSFFSMNNDKKMNDEEKNQFWERFMKHNRRIIDGYSDTPGFDQFQRQRVIDAEKVIVESDDMKKMFEKHHTYAEELRKKNITELIGEIQPRWRKRNGNLSDKEGELMCIAMMEYRLRGCDMEYFTSGFGSCGQFGSCVKQFSN